MDDAQSQSDVAILLASLQPLPEPIAKPFLIVVSGLPGTGKSLLSRELAKRLPMVILETDSIRKTLFPSPNYSASESAQLFQTCHSLIELLLQKGIPLTLDATNLVERHREHLYHIAEKVGAKLVLIQVEAPQEVVRHRLENRGNNPEDHSDADWGVYQKMKPSAQVIRRNHYSVDTSGDITPFFDKVTRELRRWMRS